MSEPHEPPGSTHDPLPVNVDFTIITSSCQETKTAVQVPIWSRFGRTPYANRTPLELPYTTTVLCNP